MDGDSAADGRKTHGKHTGNARETPRKITRRSRAFRKRIHEPGTAEPSAEVWFRKASNLWTSSPSAHPLVFLWAALWRMGRSVADVVTEAETPTRCRKFQLSAHPL